ncbi:hypothetical protein FIBSPDRAFT_965094 [Athelia psychrophila]|uniref:F-box domain-containing protein n=1 Tax=Athelia psychrophila TaxID=1759441 RepID=A0A165X1B8_9AGAM|nr:hypothetical protein FIBSPDRAFT_965094 [Fibularhizoctonia sp. CBS 109695]
MDRRQRLLSLSKRLEEMATTRRNLLLQLEGLDAQEQAVQLEHNILHNLDAPTLNLPNELLSMIFEAGISIYREKDPVLGARSDFGQVISHVSHHWRSIALDIPSLWTEICYNHHPLRACTAYLSRSRKAPVDIYINRPYFDRELTSSLLDSLSENIGRCRSLYIAPAGPEFQQQVLECTSRYAAPLLRSFSISDSYYATQFSAPLFASGAPRLRIVQLVGLNLNAAFQAYCTPAFEAVTHLELSEVYIHSSESYTSFRAILVALQSLQHVELRLAGLDPLTHHGQPPIVLPALKLLHMEFAECCSDFDFINRCIRAPSLISLSLAGWYREYKALDESILADSHLPSLRHLFLSNHVSAALRQIDALSKAYPHIERLTCRVNLARLGEDIEGVLEAMTGSTAEEDGEGRAPDGRIRWPQMQSIALEGLREPIDATGLRRTVLKLRKPGSSIHTILLPRACFNDGDVECLKDIMKIEVVEAEWPTPFEPYWFD